jgi:hypothetical protein
LPTLYSLFILPFNFNEIYRALITHNVVVYGLLRILST